MTRQLAELVRRLATALAVEVSAFHGDEDLVAYEDELNLLRQAHLEVGLDDDTLEVVERIAVAVEARPDFARELV